jgi:hypothetical protein
MKLQTPKYLTDALAAEAVNMAIANAQKSCQQRLFAEFHSGYVVVLVPAFHPDRLYEAPTPQCIYERGDGFPEDMEHPYGMVALRQAFRFWHRVDLLGGDKQDTIVPHLLLRDDEPEWSGLKRDGVAVVYAGDIPVFCRQAIVSDTLEYLIALAKSRYESDESRSRSAVVAGDMQSA